MDKRVAQFIREVAQTVVGLNSALYLQNNPKTFDTAAGLALRMRYPVEAVTPVVERFADYGLMNLLCMLSESYIDDPETRKEIVRILISQRQQQATKERESLPPANS